MAYDTEHRDVIVESEGTGIGTILGIILAIVVVLAIVWFFFLGGMGQGDPNAPPAEQNPPAEQVPPVEQPVEPAPPVQ